MVSTQNKICLALLSLCFLIFSFFCLFAPFFFFFLIFLHIPLFICLNSVPSRLTTTKGDLLNSVLQILLHEMSFPCRLIPRIYFKVASSQRYMWLRSCKDATLCLAFSQWPWSERVLLERCRDIFNWVSRVIRDCIGFLSLCDCSWNLAPAIPWTN